MCVSVCLYRCMYVRVYECPCWLFTLNRVAFCSIIKTTTCNYGQCDINVGLHRTWDVLINTWRYTTVYLWPRCNTSFIMNMPYNEYTLSLSMYLSVSLYIHYTYIYYVVYCALYIYYVCILSFTDSLAV